MTSMGKLGDHHGEDEGPSWGRWVTIMGKVSDHPSHGSCPMNGDCPNDGEHSMNGGYP